MSVIISGVTVDYTAPTSASRLRFLHDIRLRLGVAVFPDTFKVMPVPSSSPVDQRDGHGEPVPGRCREAD